MPDQGCFEKSLIYSVKLDISITFLKFCCDNIKGLELICIIVYLTN